VLLLCAIRNGESDNARANTNSFFIGGSLSIWIVTGTAASMLWAKLQVALRSAAVDWVAYGSKPKVGAQVSKIRELLEGVAGLLREFLDDLRDQLRLETLKCPSNGFGQPVVV